MALEVKDAVSILGLLGSFLAAGIAISNFIKAEKQKRAEHFFKLRDKYNADDAFIAIRRIIDGAEGTAPIDIDDLRKFLGFYEEIAIMVNSKLIREELAFYMFGYYAVRCREMDVFKNYIAEDADYWAVFMEFADRMENHQKNIKQLDRSKVVI